jgi:hypothetical protein
MSPWSQVQIPPPPPIFSSGRQIDAGVGVHESLTTGASIHRGIHGAGNRLPGRALELHSGQDRTSSNL